MAKPSFFNSFLKSNFIFWILIVLLVIGCAVFLYFISYAVLSTNKTTIPLTFLSSYQKVAKTSYEIVEFINASHQLVEEADSVEQQLDYSKALSLINQARLKNNQVHDLAFELSQNLEEMVKSLAQLPTLESRQLGYEAAALEFSLTSEFIAYSQAMNRFLDSLNLAIAIDNFQNRQKVNKALQEVNQKILLINNLNRQYLHKIVFLSTSLNKIKSK